MKKIFIIFSFVLLSKEPFAQISETNADSQKIVTAKDSFTKTTNTAKRSDSIVSLKKLKKNTRSLRSDSLLKDSAAAPVLSIPHKNKNWKEDTTFLKLLSIAGFGNEKELPGIAGKQRAYKSTDHLFYIMAGLLFLLAWLRLTFPKYFQNIFSLSFQVKFRQTQTRDLLLQNRLPALLLNIYFIFSAGLFITLLAQYFKWVAIDFWWLYLYITLVLAVIYLAKYLFINFTGWIFKAEQPAASYNFIVFLINKVLGIILIPFTVLFAFSDEEIKKIVITIAACIIFSLLAFRYIVSLLTVKRNLNISAFHFFIYLCAIEVLPMLIIYKVLFLETAAKN